MPPSLRLDPLDKTLTMERHVASLRAIVIGFNIAAYFAFIGVHAPRAGLALTVVGIAGAYGVWSLATRPYERYPLLRFGAATLTVDTLLITLWVLGTGGPSSEFWVIYFVSIVSVAMRYDVGQTLVVAIGQAAFYSVAMAIDGGLADAAIAVRPVYILIVGLAAGLLARQERIADHQRIVAAHVADERATMLEREHGLVERLTELDALKTDFVANAAHELRTPLTTLSGLSATLADRWRDLEPEELSWAFESMRRQGERARILIDNLLDLSALERGKLMIALTPVSLATVVGNALETAPPPPEKEVIVDVGEARAIADPNRLQQVLTNLLVNAYRYGGSSIELRAAAESATIVLTIADDGSGVPAAVTAHLFEPFARGDNVEAKPGSGLGLAISRRLVQAFGGELWYEAKVPRGSTFNLRLRAA